MGDFEQRRKRAANEWQSHFGEILDGIASGITIVGDSGRIEYANHDAEKIFGATTDELVGKLCDDPTLGLCAPDGSVLTEGQVCRCHGARETLPPVEQAILRPDGSEIIVLASSAPVRDAATGTIAGVINTYTDISKAKEAEYVLRENEEYNASLLRLYPLLGRADSYSDILAALYTEIEETIGYSGVGLGVTREDGEGFLILDVHGESLQGAVDGILQLDDRYRAETPTETFLDLPIRGDAMLEEIAEGTHIVVVEDALTDPRTNKELVRASQQHTIINVPLMLSGKMLGTLVMSTFGDEGIRPPTRRQLDYLSALSNHVAVAVDRVSFLRKRYQAEEALRISQRKLALHLEQTLLGVIEMDTQARIKEWNPAAEAIFGYGRDEAIGRSILELTLEPSMRPGMGSLIEALLQDNGGEFSTIDNVTKDGRTILCEWFNTPLVDDGGAIVGIMSLARDITEHRQAEELRVAKEAAEAATVAKSAFLATMSHEIRTPMNAILGFSQLMRNDKGLSERQRHQLDIINSSGEHLLALINDVLEMSKVEAGRISAHPTTFNVRSLVDEMGSLFGLRAQAKGLELRVSCADDTPRFIVTDEHKLRQVFVNLLANAVKFTDKGSVELRVSVRLNDEGQLRLEAEVEDTGRGIAAEDMDRLFRHFEQAAGGRDSEAGTGLGLAISREFAQLLGGQISVSSELGVGSIFKFDIAVEEAEEGATTGRPEERRVAGLRPGSPLCRILVVDDATDSRELLVQLLEPIGFSVRAASNGKEALDEFKEWSPQLILMDMHMPVMDGYEATRRIRASAMGADVAIVAVTASAFSETRQGVFDAGVDEFIVKPFRANELLGKVAKLLDVHYVCDEPRERAEWEAADSIDPAAMAAMPAQLIDRIRQATLQADFDAVIELITQVGSHDDGAAAAIHTLAERFDSEKILAALPVGGEDS